jgi:hypothetical protein
MFLLLFPLFWWGLFTLVARIGGWAELAMLYRRDDAFFGTTWRFRNGQMRKLAAYNNALTVGADRRGFFLAVSFFFFPSHPKLFIPWTDISAARQGDGQTGFLELRFLRAPGVFLRLSLELGEKLIAVRDGKAQHAE